MTLRKRVQRRPQRRRGLGRRETPNGSLGRDRRRQWSCAGRGEAPPDESRHMADGHGKGSAGCPLARIDEGLRETLPGWFGEILRIVFTEPFTEFENAYRGQRWSALPTRQAPLAGAPHKVA
jgi:hypothetical protein